MNTGPDLSAESIERLLARFRQARLLVMGDVMLDEYLVGEVRRISPEAPVPVVDITHTAHIPGGAANVASNVASLGGSPILIGLVGTDECALRLASALAGSGVSGDGLITATDRPTTAKTRIVSGQQQIVRVDKETRAPITSLQSQAVMEAFEKHIGDADACLLSDYAKGLLTPEVCRYIIGRTVQLGKPVIVDPKDATFLKYAGCTVITPNLREAEIASGQTVHSEGDLLVCADRLHSTLGNTAVLVTRGADGMTLFRRDEAPIHAPALAREVFDVTGAGDTVVSTLALALASGAKLEEAMSLANIAASVVVQKTGTAAVSVQELLSSAHWKSGVPETGLSSNRSYSSVPNRSSVRQ
jgi:rfaE bifunctional protein kinase chain/domain